MPWKSQEPDFLCKILHSTEIFLKYLLCIKSQNITDNVFPFLGSGQRLEASEQSSSRCNHVFPRVLNLLQHSPLSWPTGALLTVLSSVPGPLTSCAKGREEKCTKFSFCALCPLIEWAVRIRDSSCIFLNQTVSFDWRLAQFSPRCTQPLGCVTTSRAFK